MNYMSEVAKMFGVELGESFYINTQGDTEYVFTANGLFPAYGSVVCNNTLNELLTGTASIKRKPWKPKYGEEYWFVEILTDEDGYVGSEEYFDECSVCVNYYKIGNCYRTKKEAEANIDKWIKFYASDEVLEV